MIFNDIFELEMVGVVDRGVPNKERIVFRVTEDTDLGQFGIMLGVIITGGLARPIRDNLFWFGDGTVRKDDWIFVFTGTGKPNVSRISNTDNTIVSVFWGRKTVMLDSAMLVPVLFRINGVVVGDANPHLLSDASQNPIDDRG